MLAAAWRSWRRASEWHANNFPFTCNPLEMLQLCGGAAAGAGCDQRTGDEQFCTPVLLKIRTHYDEWFGCSRVEELRRELGAATAQEAAARTHEHASQAEKAAADQVTVPTCTC